MEAMTIILGVFLLIACYITLACETIFDRSMWMGRDRRADELLRSVLTQEQYGQLMRQSYIDIKSPRDPERIYRVPRGRGLVEVIEQGRSTARLCLQSLVRLPDADIVVMHKLMIEADEETYLHIANSFTPIESMTEML
jgi:hypothetical protein